MKTGVIGVEPVASAAYSRHRGCQSLGLGGKAHDLEEQSLRALHVVLERAGRAVLRTTLEVAAADKHYHHYNRHERGGNQGPE